MPLPIKLSYSFNTLLSLCSSTHIECMLIRNEIDIFTSPATPASLIPINNKCYSYSIQFIINQTTLSMINDNLEFLQCQYPTILDIYPKWSYLRGFREIRLFGTFLDRPKIRIGIALRTLEKQNVSVYIHIFISDFRND